MYVDYPATPEGRKLCKSQKINSSEHYSFNLFGLLTILTVGSLLILASHTVSPVVGHFQKWSKSEKARLRRQEWENMDVLQLLRLLLQRQGITPWRIDELVPVLSIRNPLFKMSWLSGHWAKASSAEVLDGSSIVESMEFLKPSGAVHDPEASSSSSRLFVGGQWLRPVPN
jgi:hypothetical protein